MSTAGDLKISTPEEINTPENISTPEKLVMSIIHPTCFNEEGQCLHWAQTTVDNQPLLYHGGNLKSDDPHFSTLSADGKSISGEGCDNPWNYVSDTYAQKIKAACPRAIAPPTNGKRPVTNLKICTQAEVIKEFKNSIGADCWSIYSRDPQTHRVVKQYYFLKHPSYFENEENAKDEKSDLEREKRDDLLEDPKILVDDLENKLEICISLGCFPFIDEYYRKIATDCYVVVSVDCFEKQL